MNGDHSVFPMHLLEKSLRSFYLVALLKGPARVDSRNPRQLLANIQAAPGARLTARAGEVVPLPLRVENRGRHALARGPEQGGRVREPHRLGARLELLAPAPPTRVARATPVSVRIRATNTGDTRWLTGSPEERGAVCLGVQLRDGAGALLTRDYIRVPLPRPADPGEAVEIDAVVPAPPESGRFRLWFDLVAEQICWFEHHGSIGLAIDLETT